MNQILLNLCAPIENCNKCRKMETSYLLKAREHAKDGMALLKTKEYEKALKKYEFGMQYFLEVLAGKRFLVYLLLLL